MDREPAEGDTTADDATGDDAARAAARERQLARLRDVRAQRARAEALRARAAAAFRVAQALQADHKAAWLARYGRAVADGVVVVHCAWCGRVRGPAGPRWGRATAWRPGEEAGVCLSHGLCPDCEATHFPPDPATSG